MFLDVLMQFNWTPLFLAAWGGHLDVVKYLLKNANCNSKIRDVVSETLHVVDLAGPFYMFSCFPSDTRTDVTYS